MDNGHFSVYALRTLCTAVHFCSLHTLQLRTVPTKYKDFCFRLEPREKKVDLCKGYCNRQREMGVATHFFEVIGLEPQQKC